MNNTPWKSRSLFVVFGILSCICSSAPAASGQRERAKREKKSEPQVAQGDRFKSADGGRTLHDNLLHVTWLLDANVGKSECKNLVSPGGGGGMDWRTAFACVAQLDSGKGFLGHKNWQMPATPKHDRTCATSGPHQNSFGAHCSGSSYGSLFYLAWKRDLGETVALQSGPSAGGFTNLQPTLYWYGNRLNDDTAKKQDNGYNSFSFSNGWQGANVDNHPMYVIPVIAGKVPENSPAAKATIWDPTAESGVKGRAGITWLANANIAADQHFLEEVKAGKLTIEKDGSMDHKTAQQLITLMQQNKYLGRGDWMLPLANNTNCHIAKSGTNGGYDCNVSSMGHLYYTLFKLQAGAAVNEPPDIPEVKPFVHVQPSLYWACMADTVAKTNPQGNLCASEPTAAPGFGFSFDMGNGFTDTTIIGSDLYLMVYYPDPLPKR